MKWVGQGKLKKNQLKTPQNLKQECSKYVDANKPKTKTNLNENKFKQKQSKSSSSDKTRLYHRCLIS